MGNNIEAIHRRNAGPLTVGEPEPTAYRLFNQGPGVGGAKGDNGVEIGYIPTLFKHIYMNNDFRGFLKFFHRQKPLNKFLFFFTLLI
jgi:hypothetical protein